MRPQRLWPGLLASVALSACGGDPSGPSDPPLGNTPDDVVADLVHAWNDRDDAAVAALLSADFVFYVSPADAESAGVPRSWGRETEVASTEHLFAGETGVGPDGTPQPPADPRFSFGLTMVAEDEWTLREDAPYAGMLARRFQNSMTVQYENFDLDFILGSQIFFVTEESGIGDGGAPVPRYRLAAWRDLGQNPGLRHQAFTWGFLKALYREIYSGDPGGRSPRARPEPDPASEKSAAHSAPGGGRKETS